MKSRSLLTVLVLYCLVPRPVDAADDWLSKARHQDKEVDEKIAAAMTLEVGHAGVEAREPGAGLANGTLNPVVGREIPLAEAPRAHEAVMEPGALGKIVLIP